jgi:hypothetical protein
MGVRRGLHTHARTRTHTCPRKVTIERDAGTSSCAKKKKWQTNEPEAAGISRTVFCSLVAVQTKLKRQAVHVVHRCVETVGPTE